MLVLPGPGTPPYLEDGEGKRVAQVVLGGQQHPAVVSIQVHAGQQVQLGVDPVEAAVGQVWSGRRRPDGETQQRQRGGKKMTQSDRDEV